MLWRCGPSPRRGGSPKCLCGILLRRCRSPEWSRSPSKDPLRLKAVLIARCLRRRISSDRSEYRFRSGSSVRAKIPRFQRPKHFSNGLLASVPHGPVTLQRSGAGIPRGLGSLLAANPPGTSRSRPTFGGRAATEEGAAGAPPAVRGSALLAAPSCGSSGIWFPLGRVFEEDSTHALPWSTSRCASPRAGCAG